MGENLKVVWAKFSTMSLAVFIGTGCKVIFILTPKMFYKIDTKVQCYKTFYVRNL